MRAVSGALAIAASRAGVDAEGAGLLGIVSGTTYALRMARDRMLVVTGAGDPLVPGWNDEGYAVTPMSGALAVIEISGPNALHVIKRSTVIPTSAPGRCAAISFAGVTVCLYRFEQEATFRLHVDRGLAPYLWHWFEAMAQNEG